jgi:hypothetical protein
MPLSTKPGVAGALARFWRRTYAADYVALGVVAAGWIMVSEQATLYAESMEATEVEQMLTITE